MGSCNLALDIGGTKIAAAAYAPDLTALPFTVTKPTAELAEPSKLATFVQEVGAELAHRGYSCAGVGVAVAGSVDTHSGRVIMSPNARWLDGVNLRAFFEPMVQVPVYVANDADCFALAEAHAGAAAGKRHVVALTLGTGIGGGLVLDGKLHRGTGIGANELGHLTINYRGPTCGCGSYGCLEAYCGGWALPHRAAELLYHYEGSTPVFQAVRQELRRDRANQPPAAATPTADEDTAPGKRELSSLPPHLLGALDGAALHKAACDEDDPFAHHFWQYYGTWMGAALASVLNLLRPEAFVFGGAGARSLPLFEATLRDVVAARVMPPLHEQLLYEQATAPHPNTLGAALLTLALP